MGISKTENFNEAEIKAAEMFKALAHPARIKIISFLAKENSCICGDIVNEIGLSQSTVSQHLKVMKAAGIIKGTVEGASVCYCIDSEAIDKIQDIIKSIKINTSLAQVCC
jgi:DNA-binding transcriptional ArsR family regulator